jgi:hypothetical protein
MRRIESLFDAVEWLLIYFFDWIGEGLGAEEKQRCRALSLHSFFVSSLMQVILFSHLYLANGIE